MDFEGILFEVFFKVPHALRTEQFFREKLASFSRFAFFIVFAFVKWISSDSYPPTWSCGRTDTYICT